jgi:hypothetical protein
MKGHKDPRRLKWGAWSSRRSKDKASLLYCQASGREVRIIHYHEREYRPNGSPDQQGANASVPSERDMQARLVYGIGSGDIRSRCAFLAL